MVPTSTPAPIFWIIPLLLGTLLVSIGAIVLSLPFGIAVAIYMAEIANKRTRDLLKPIIELLAGIPSVVYGFFGLVVIVPLIQKTFDLPVGETAFAAAWSWRSWRSQRLSPLRKMPCGQRPAP